MPEATLASTPGSQAWGSTAEEQVPGQVPGVGETCWPSVLL